MRMFAPLALAGLWVSAAVAAISIDVFHADEQTPLHLADPNTPSVYQDIMVGTKLTFFVRCDSEQGWAGAFWFPLEYAPLATFSGRNYEENERGIGNYTGSCLESAGFLARVYRFADNRGFGFDLFGGGFCSPGDWFVFDYEAETVGTCHLGLYELGPDPENPPLPIFAPGYEPPPGIATLVNLLTINHVPSRDFNDDGSVNLVDFAILANQWRETANADPNATLTSDLDTSGFVDIWDVTQFSEFWLERIDANEPAGLLSNN